MKKIIKLSKPLFLELILMLLTAQPAVALTGVELKSPADINTKILCPIARWMFGIFIAVAVIVILIAAYMYLTAGGDEEQIKKATKTLTYAAIAVAVAIIAGSFPTLIGNLFKVQGISTCR